MTTITNVAGAPMGSVAAAIEAAGGVEEEFFIAGNATTYALAGGLTEYPTDGRWLAEPTDRHAEFRTRMIVVRPDDPATFNGTVLVNWNNVSAGESFVQPDRAAQLVGDGFVLVGVSAQAVGVEGRGGGLPALKTGDPSRYGDLHHPGDDFSYDIFTQAGQLVSANRNSAVDPLDGLDVQHVLAMGGSQSAARLATYINGIQPLTNAFDAFFLVVFPNAPCSLTKASAPVEVPQAGRGNMAEMLRWYEHTVRDDLDIPVIVLNSEWEAAQCYPNHQDDTEFVRWWEVAGAGHVGSATPDEIGVAAAFGFVTSTVSFAPALRAAVHALRDWLDGGGPPPRQPRLLREAGSRALRRDEHANALGGIRWPDLEAPLATHVGENLTDDISLVGGTSTPFQPDKVRALYPDHATWLAKYEAAVNQLVATKVVVPDDASKLIDGAKSFRLPY